MSLALDRQMKRWYPLIPHPIQLELIRDDVRFKLVPAGRRSGKTERAKRYLVKKAMSEAGRFFFAAAPTRDQARKIFWDDLKTLSLTSTHPEQPRETELKITFPNGSEIQVLGLDNPARIEGSLWHGGVIDEIADCKPDAWAFHVQPALDTVHPLDPGYRAWCWLTGVPDSWVICMMLTAIVLILAVFGAGVGPLEATEAWGLGLWTLLELAMLLK